MSSNRIGFGKGTPSDHEDAEENFYPEVPNENNTDNTDEDNTDVVMTDNYDPFLALADAASSHLFGQSSSSNAPPLPSSGKKPLTQAEIKARAKNRVKVQVSRFLNGGKTQTAYNHSARGAAARGRYEDTHPTRKLESRINEGIRAIKNYVVKLRVQKAKTEALKAGNEKLEKIVEQEKKLEKMKTELKNKIEKVKDLITKVSEQAGADRVSGYTKRLNAVIAENDVNRLINTVVGIPVANADPSSQPEITLAYIPGPSSQLDNISETETNTPANHARASILDVDAADVDDVLADEWVAERTPQPVNQADKASKEKYENSIKGAEAREVRNVIDKLETAKLNFSAAVLKEKVMANRDSKAKKKASEAVAKKRATLLERIEELDELKTECRYPKNIKKITDSIEKANGLLLSSEDSYVMPAVAPLVPAVASHHDNYPIQDDVSVHSEARTVNTMPAMPVTFFTPAVPVVPRNTQLLVNPLNFPAPANLHHPHTGGYDVPMASTLPPQYYYNRPATSVQDPPAAPAAPTPAAVLESHIPQVPIGWLPGGRRFSFSSQGTNHNPAGSEAWFSLFPGNTGNPATDHPPSMPSSSNNNVPRQ